MEKIITIKGPTYELFGILHQAERSRSIILICNGLNGDRVDIHRTGVQFSRYACSMNMSSLRFDYRGHGVSDCEFQYTSRHSRIEDAELVVSNIDKNIPIDLIGFSDGAIIAYNIAKKYPDRLRKVVFWSPLIINEDSTNINLLKVTREKLYGQLVCPILGLWFGVPFLKAIKEPVHISNIGKPLMVITGTKDTLVGSSVDQIIKNNPNTKHYQIVGANHVYSDVEWKSQLFKQTIAFLKER